MQGDPHEQADQQAGGWNMHDHDAVDPGDTLHTVHVVHTMHTVQTVQTIYT